MFKYTLRFSLNLRLEFELYKFYAILNIFLN